MTLARLLRGRGYEVHESSTILEAVGAIVDLADRIDLAVLDYFLPLGDSTSVRHRDLIRDYHLEHASTAEAIADSLYAHRVGATLVYVSAHSPATMRHIVAGTRAAGYICKPFTPDEVLTVLQHAHGLHRQRSALGSVSRDALHGRTVSGNSSIGLPPGSYRRGLLQVVLRLAGVSPDDKPTKKVLRTILDGIKTEEAHRSCAMSLSTYTRRKAELRHAIGIENFGGDLVRRIDEALATGEVQPWDLLGHPAFPPSAFSPFSRVTANRDAPG